MENVSKLLILLLYASLRQFFSPIFNPVHQVCHFFWDSFTASHWKNVYIGRIIVQFLGNFTGCILRNFFTFVILFCNKKIFYAFLDMFSFHWQKRDKGRDVIIYNTATVNATFKKSININLQINKNYNISLYMYLGEMWHLKIVKWIKVDLNQEIISLEFWKGWDNAY